MISEEGIEKALEDIETLKKAIKATNRKLQQLVIAHDAIANQHAQTLLELQQAVALLKINSDVDFFTSIIDTQLPKETTMRTQVITEASAVKSNIAISSSPHRLIAEFYNKWSEILRDKGADFIIY